MTLFGLFWAAFLPSPLPPVDLPKTLTLQAANPYAAGHLQAAATPSASAYPLRSQRARGYRARRLSSLAHTPRVPVNWDLWRAIATVAVVPAGDRPGGHLSSLPVSLTSSGDMGSCGSVQAAPAEDTAGYTVQVKAVALGQVASGEAAEDLAHQLRQALPRLEAKPQELLPSLGPTAAGGQLDGQVVFTLPQASGLQGTDAAIAATQWVNNLRLALGASPLEPAPVQMVAAGLGETHHTFSGTASWYGPYFHGRQTATGETFNQHDLTAAHKTLPFGTYLKVHNANNGRTVVVRINDRGPYVGDRSLDLSYAAAQCLGGDRAGVIPYQATILAPGVPQAWRSEAIASLP